MADTLPSCSSHFWKPCCISLRNRTEYAMMKGIGATAIAAIFAFMENMKYSDIPMRMRMRNTEVSCSATNVRMRSTSVVQRWMMSPVWFFWCQANGSRSMCENSVSRMRLTRISDARVFSMVPPGRRWPPP